MLAEQSKGLAELGVDLAESSAVIGETPKLAGSYLGGRAITIAGGTSEISRNTIAERNVGLPHDPLLK